MSATQGRGAQHVFRDTYLPVLTAISLAFTPLAVAVIGARASSSNTTKDYVSLAVSILNAKDSRPANRKWAIQVLEAQSPVPVPDDLKRELGNGDALTIPAPELHTVTRTIEVAQPCISEERLAFIIKHRPARLTKQSFAGKDFQDELETRAAALDGYVDFLINDVARSCARLSAGEPSSSRRVSPR